MNDFPVTIRPFSTWSFESRLCAAVLVGALGWYGLDYLDMKAVAIAGTELQSPSVVYSNSDFAPFFGDDAGSIAGIEDEGPAKPENEAAPVSAKQVLKSSAVSYIEKFAPTAMAEAKQYGVPASISLAQGLVESRAGKSLLAQKCNNHFGIKCFSKKHRGCCMKFYDDSNADGFRIFEKGPWGSWRAHSILLSSGRYKKLHDHGLDFRKWARGLQAAGYATDREYAKKLIGMIEKYDLSQFDK